MGSSRSNSPSSAFGTFSPVRGGEVVSLLPSRGGEKVPQADEGWVLGGEVEG